jgi:fatty-acyl-CoA synthase
VWRDRRLTYAQVTDRSRRLATYLRRAGLGCHVERSELPGHLSGQDHLALYLYNGNEYIEGMLGAFKSRVAPFNVNYRYVAEELRYLFNDAKARAVMYHSAFAPALAEVLPSLPDVAVLLQVADESGNALLPGAVDYETALASVEPEAPVDLSPDDLYILYTGGTTGMPKGVMWRNDDLYVSLWRMGRPGTDPPDPIAAARDGKRAGTCLPACPLMHGTGLFIALSTLSGGGSVVVIDAPGLDPARVWTEVERNGVEVLTIVGDVFARPLLAALDAEPSRWDLSSLRAITSSGVTWSPETKAGLLRHVPQVTLLDSLGASEGMASRQAATADDAEIKPARFAVNERVKVFREGSGEEVTPGSDEIGLLAVGGRIPVGYWRDPDKTAQTFRVIDGRRYALAGDYAQVDADGTIRLLGRGSACINTGGEKVYPEEVELALRRHPSVFDCVAVGVPDDRFGEIVVAIVQVTEGHYLDEAELDAWCRNKLAGFKKPRRFLFVDSLERNAAGKANYEILRKLAAARLGQ